MLNLGKIIGMLCLVMTARVVLAADLPSDSLYQLDVPLVDSNGDVFHLAQLAGQPVTLSMFYGSCQSACPVLLRGLKLSVAALSARQRGGLRIVLISLDPVNDTAASLARLADEQHLDPKVFRLAVAASEAQTRSLAGVMGIKYRRLPNGEINHSTRVLLLDAQGRITSSSERISARVDPVLLNAWRKAL